MIAMKIRVTKVEEPSDGSGNGFPVVHFKGFSRSLDGSWDENANSDLRGGYYHTRGTVVSFCAVWGKSLSDID